MGREIVKSEISEETSSNWSTSSSSYEEERRSMPLLALNHVSFVCKSVASSVKFYEDVLGFVLIKRPSSFDFEGAWLFNHGIGIHLLGKEDVEPKKGKINPKDNHISFQCTDMELIIQKLALTASFSPKRSPSINRIRSPPGNLYASCTGILFLQSSFCIQELVPFVCQIIKTLNKHQFKKIATVKEGGVIVDQLFFHDPDGNMIEICNCQNLPVLPLSSCPLKKFANPTFNQTLSNSFYGEEKSKMNCSREVESLMMENLAMDMIDISF